MSISLNRLEEARRKLDVALQGVRHELAKADRGEAAVVSKEQLTLIDSKLAEMLQSLGADSNTNRVKVPGLWHIVTDTWPYQDPLRQQIVEAEFAYEQCSK